MSCFFSGYLLLVSFVIMHFKVEYYAWTEETKMHMFTFSCDCLYEAFVIVISLWFLWSGYLKSLIIESLGLRLTFFLCYHFVWQMLDIQKVDKSKVNSGITEEAFWRPLFVLMMQFRIFPSHLLELRSKMLPATHGGLGGIGDTNYWIDPKMEKELKFLYK